MFSFKLSPYIHFIESRLIPESIHFAAFNRLTGQMVSVSKALRDLLSNESSLSFTTEDLTSAITQTAELRSLISTGFVIPLGADPVTPFRDWTVTRPIQNPAIVYNLADERWFLVRTPVSRYVFSPDMNELPSIIEEQLPALAAEIFLLADGSKTLRDTFENLTSQKDPMLSDGQFREALDFLTDPEHQLIKFAPPNAPLDDPYQSFNTVPRSLYLGRADTPARTCAGSSIDFHQRIKEASWEFDLVEPTVNHAFRFPSKALGGLDYGARFCVSSFKPNVLPLLEESAELRVLEVGGGTGSFARSFLEKATELARKGAPEIDYHMLELSPALMASQKEVLARSKYSVRHYCQEATIFNLPGQKFALIIANEVAADFPVAAVKAEYSEKPEVGETTGRSWSGDAASYVNKYGLADDTAPDSFLVNVGALRFIERCFEHLVPGGTIILTEYGSESQFPARAFHLNHAEYSIHFGHLKKCAETLGMACRLIEMKKFLQINEEVSMLAGHEEHIMCLNHIFKQFGASMSYRAYSQIEFENEFADIVKHTKLTGFSFIPLRNGFYYGPRIEDFHVLIMNRPRH